jgi:transcriptional regulator with XRE-family HTH domain
MIAQGINRTELARRLGTSKPYITEMLSGEVNMTLDTIAKVARAIEAEIRFDLRTYFDP